MRISFLCNSLLSLQAAQALEASGMLIGMAAYAGNQFLCQQILSTSEASSLHFAKIHKDSIEADLITWLSETNPDAVIVHTFPFKIPETCLNIPPRGFFNLHPGPLPTYRGPDPVFWQMKHGNKTSGITVHKMEADFDTGPICHYQETAIESYHTYGLLQTDLSFAAQKAIEVFIEQLEADRLPPFLLQDNAHAAFYKKATAQDLLIDWTHMTSDSVSALVRACNPHQNGAIAFFRGVITRVLEVTPLKMEAAPKLPAGTVIAADPARGIQVLCADGHAVKLNILHVEEGYFSGVLFCEVFEVRIGDKFTAPACLS